jgi:hypothetical protein
MEMQNFKKTPLVISSDTYKIYIPNYVESKIKYVCQNIENIEWSGVLFYDYTGSFETKDLVIKCVDLYVMDIGNSTFTEFIMSPEVITYMTENPELLDCQLGLIHSHHNMATFFSNTDLNTLREEGLDRNHFVSLIVNNKGTYSAAITRLINGKAIVNKEASYKSFNDHLVSYKNDSEEDFSIVEYSMLNINFDKVYDFSNLSSRLSELKLKDAQKGKYIGNKGDISNFKFENDRGIQKELPFIENEIKDDDISMEEEYSIPYECIEVDDDYIKSLLYQLLTGSIIINNTSKIDINKWVDNMPKIFTQRFGDGNVGFKNFQYWCNDFITFLCVDDNILVDIGSTLDENSAIKAYFISKELSKFKSNKYIDYMINTLQEFIL